MLLVWEYSNINYRTTGCFILCSRKLKDGYWEEIKDPPLYDNIPNAFPNIHSFSSLYWKGILMRCSLLQVSFLAVVPTAFPAFFPRTVQLFVFEYFGLNFVFRVSCTTKTWFFPQIKNICANSLHVRNFLYVVLNVVMAEALVRHTILLLMNSMVSVGAV